MSDVNSRVVRTAVIALIAQAIALNAAAESGQVLERGTNNPIAGVYVVSEWRGSIASVVQSHSVCYHANITMTDSDGRYRVPTLSGNFNPAIINRNASHYLYKPGFQEVTAELEKSSVRYMAQRTAERAKTFSVVSRLRLGRQCDEDQKSFLAARKAQVEELEKLAQTPKERNTADGFRFGIEKLEFGEQVADEKDQLRRRERTKASVEGVR